MNIKGGALEFDIIAKNDKIKSTLEETKRCVQTFTSATVAGGEQMETAYAKTAARIEAAFKDIDAMAAIHSNAIEDLQTEYTKLGEQAGAAFMKGTAQGDKEYNTLKERQSAIQGEITQRQALLSEIGRTADALHQEEQELLKRKDAVEKNAEHQVSFRTQIRNTREELIRMEQAGQRGTQQYADMQQELGRLQDAMDDASQQARVLANDQANFQGIITGLSGVTGAFAAAQGAVGLFAGENENLDKIMTKVQSAMSITIGLQQFSQAVNKDSAFMLVTVAKAKAWWAAVVAKATGVQVTNTAVTTAQTTATTAQAAAATAGTVANTGLAAAFRLVGTAIMSIPGIGWILAGISGLVALVAGLTKSSRDAAKATKELNAATVEGAYKSVGVVKQLATEWEQLGESLDAKKKFIEDNAEAFDKLGVAIKDVADAENLLTNGAQAFINSQIAKAKAAAVLASADKWVKQSVEADLELEKANKTPKVTRFASTGMYGQGYSYEIDNPAIEKAKEKQTEANTELQKAYALAGEITAQGLKELKEAGIEGQEEVTEGTIAWYELQISEKQKYLKTLSVLDTAEIKATQDKIATLQKVIDGTTGETSNNTGGSNDPFTDKLNERKKLYSQYFKWVNSQDSILQKAANTEFASLLSEGSSYIDYLKTQREQLLALAEKTPEQTENLRKLNDEIANETKGTVLADFDNELKTRLQGARSILEMLNILEEKRKALANDDSDLDNGKKDIIDTAQTSVEEQAAEQTKGLINHYSEYLAEKLEFEARYAENSRLLNEQLAKAKTEDEKRIAQEAINGLNKDKAKYSAQTGNEDYDKLVADYKTFQQKCADISADYDEKIALAKANNNTELLLKLKDEQQNALSSAALEQLQNSGALSELAGNLDEVTTTRINQLIQKIEEQKAQLGIELSPEDLKVVMSQLEAAKQEIAQRNPFKALTTAIKEYDKESKKVSNQKLFTGISDSVDLVKGSFDAAINGISKMGIEMDSVTQGIINDIGGILDGAGQLATGIATGNPLSIIQGSIGLLSSGLSLLDTGSKRRNEKLAQEMEYYNSMVQVYDTLIAKQKELTSSMSGKDAVSAYKEGLDMITAQTEAAKYSLQSWFKSGASLFSHSEGYKYNKDFGGQLSQSKMFSMGSEDWERLMIDNTELWAKLPQQVKDYAQAVIDAGASTEELGEMMNESLAGFSLDEAKGQLEELISGAELSFSDISDSFASNMEKAIMRVVSSGADERLAAWYKGVAHAMADGVLTQAERDALKATYEGIITDADAEYEAAKDIAGVNNEATNVTTSTLSGAIKGASQESIDLLAGQTNAVRVNQVVSIDILRQQLIHLASIDSKVGTSNSLLEKIEKNTSSSGNDPLRAQGIQF